MTNIGGNAARLARPYARAAFDYAQENQQLEHWTLLLKTLADHTAQPLIKEILKNPRYNAEENYEIVAALANEVLDQAGQNFLKTLASQHRLALLPEIYILFEQSCAAIRKTLRVEVKSAVTLNNAYVTTLQTALTKKLGREVEIEQTLDPALLGGFVVYMGDQVIDNSIRGRLEKLRHVIMVK